ncbi:MAG: sigma-70 family RNA polymerase sigma factor [Clostridia bacterium]|nr:sigma-70 family RNA polymerase sigma factor [Clostridia bacterium]
MKHSIIKKQHQLNDLVSDLVIDNINNLIIKNFLLADNNVTLFTLGYLLGDEENKTILKQKFDDFLFGVKFLSYVKITIIAKAKNLRFKYSITVSNESLSLNNISNDEFNEEIITSIIDTTSLDFEEQIYQEEFWQLLSNKNFYLYINNLPQKQKSILHNYIISGLTEKEISKKLNISQQAVNKVKNKIFSNLRKRGVG